MKNIHNRSRGKSSAEQGVLQKLDNWKKVHEVNALRIVRPEMRQQMLEGHRLHVARFY